MADDDDAPRNADFIERVVSDAKDPPETRLLTGWLGDAADEGYRRLYTNAELSAYFDIPVDAILHTEPIRDAQPPGAVFVWIRRDAELKQGGSAFSRAARFLQGQVTLDFASGGGGMDFSSPEKAGYRCITQVPCGEPTGFTGQCTKQPEVGGAWPCITALPHCSEPTGFTGQCTHQPWPNPTHYIGCTFLHCPTQDLTHVPQICRIVATGMPGCGFVDPGSGGIDPAAKAAGAAGGNEGGGGSVERAAVPASSIPGCGYTQTWGLCPTLPPKCVVSVNIDCITQDNACGPTRNPACDVLLAAAPAPGFTLLPSCNTSVAGACPSAVDACPTAHGCPTVPATKLCTQFGPDCPTPATACTQFGHHCPTPATTCTQIGAHCPTSCGAECQSQQVNCTQVGEICLTHPVECTQFGPKCPSVGVPCPSPIDCTITPPICFQQPAGAQAFRAAAPIGPSGFLGCTQTGPQCPSQFGSGCRTDTAQDCTFGCTQFGPSCPTTNPVCNNPNLAARAAQPAAAGGAGAQITPLTVPVWQCWGPTPATHCFICPMPHHSQVPWLCPAPSPWCPPITQTFICGGGNPSAVDACPTRLCGGGQQFFRAAGQRPTIACEPQVLHTTVNRICL